MRQLGSRDLPDSQVTAHVEHKSQIWQVSDAHRQQVRPQVPRSLTSQLPVLNVGATDTARDCENRRFKKGPGNATPNGENSASRGKAKTSNEQMKPQAVHGRRNSKADLN